MLVSRALKRRFPHVRIRFHIEPHYGMPTAASRRSSAHRVAVAETSFTRHGELHTVLYSTEGEDFASLRRKTRRRAAEQYRETARSTTASNNMKHSERPRMPRGDKP
jgi:hypothetical protein